MLIEGGYLTVYHGGAHSWYCFGALFGSKKLNKVFTFVHC